MWFKRKVKNRRLNRDHVLDVKLRADQIRAGRFRVLTVALGVCFGLAITAFVFWRGGEWLLSRFIYENDAFAIREIEMHTDGVLAPEHLKRWAVIPPDANLLALDLLRVKRDLELVPFVKSSSVERVLPHTLRIRITEREPIAQIAVPQRRSDGSYETALYYLDEEGFVMPPLDPQFRSSPPVVTNDFPALTGFQSSEVRPGKQVRSPQIRAALQLILELEQSAMAGVADLQRIDVGATDVLQAVTTQGSEVTFALHNFHFQLHRWRIVHDEFQKTGQALAMIDLSISNNLPTRPVLASSIPAAPFKTNKPSRTRKKNV